MIKNVLWTGLFLIMTVVNIKARDITGDVDTEADYPLEKISDQLKKDIDKLFNIHGPVQSRQESCPLQSKNYQDILIKMQNIEKIFKAPECIPTETTIDKTQAAFDDYKKNSSTNSGSTSTANSDAASINGIAIDGKTIASAANGINSILTKDECKIDDRAFLEKSADIIQNFSQMGLLVPNSSGLIIAGGGLALSSLLRLIHQIFKIDFEFENHKDRASFAKLNCAFYDLRREISMSGLRTIPTKSHHNGLKEAIVLKKLIDKHAKTLLENKKTIFTSIKKLEDGEVEAKVKDNLEYLKLLEKFEQIFASKITNQDEKLGLVNHFDRSDLITMRDYTQSYSNSTLFTQAGQHLKNALDELIKYDDNLVVMNPKIFDDNIRANILQNLRPIKDSIKESIKDIIKNFNDTNTIDKKKVSLYKESISKKFEDIAKEVKKYTLKVKQVLARLKGITSEDEYFSQKDNGTITVESILQDEKDLAEEIYGSWGWDFIKAVEDAGSDYLKEFKKRFSKFSGEYLILDDREQYIIPDRIGRTPIQITSACQNATRIKNQWQLADSLVQQGHDFIATNDDLFYSDIDLPFFHPILSILGVKNPKKEIKNNEMTALQAKTIFQEAEKNNLTVKEFLEQNPEYLEQKDMNFNNSIGRLMIKVKRSKDHANILQNLIENYKQSEYCEE